MQTNHSPSPDAESVESSRLRSLARSSRALSEARPERISDPLPPDVTGSTLQTVSPSPFREPSVAVVSRAEYNYNREEEERELTCNSQLSRLHGLHEVRQEQEEEELEEQEQQEESSRTEIEKEKRRHDDKCSSIQNGCNFNNGVIPAQVNEDPEVGLSDSNYHAYRSYRSSRAPSEVPDRGEREESTWRQETGLFTRASSEVSLGEMLLTDTPLESSLISESSIRKMQPTQSLEEKTAKGAHNNIHNTSTIMHTNTSSNLHNHINISNSTSNRTKKNGTAEHKWVRRALYSVHATRENALRVRHRLYHTVKHANSQFDLFQSLHYPFDDDDDDDDVVVEGEDRDNAIVNKTRKESSSRSSSNSSISGKNDADSDAVACDNVDTISKSENANENINKQIQHTLITSANCIDNAQDSVLQVTNTDKQCDVVHETLVSENDNSQINDKNSKTEFDQSNRDDEHIKVNERIDNAVTNLPSDKNISTPTTTTTNTSKMTSDNTKSINDATNAFEGSVLEVYTMGINAEETLVPSISAFAMTTLPDPISGAALVGICVGDTSGHVEYVEMSASESNSRRIRKSRASLAQLSNRQTSHSMSCLTGQAHPTYQSHNALMPTSSSSLPAIAESESRTLQTASKQKKKELEYEQEKENESSLRCSNALPAHLIKPLVCAEEISDSSAITQNVEQADINNCNDQTRITWDSINGEHCRNNNSDNCDVLNLKEHSINRYSDPSASWPTTESTLDSRTTTQTFASLQTNVESTTSQCTLNSRLTLEARGRELVRRHSHRAYVQSINVLTSAAELPSVKCLSFVRKHSSPSTISYLTASEHVIKLFHVRRDGFCALDVFPALTSVVGETFCGSRYFARLPLQPCIQPYKEFGPTTDTIQALDTCADGETFMSVEDLQVFWWHFEAKDTTHGTCIADCRPASGLMNDVEELITAASFHPLHTSLYLLTRSSGVMNIGDLRDAPSRTLRRYAITSHITPNMNPTQHSSYDEILCSISTAAFLGPDHIVTRDYLSLKLWDLRRPETPCQMVPVMDYVIPHLDTLYDNDSIFDRFPIAVDDWSGVVVTGLYDNAVSVWQPLNTACSADDMLSHYRVHASCIDAEETFNTIVDDNNDNNKTKSELSEEKNEQERYNVKSKSLQNIQNANNKEQHYTASKVTSKQLQVLLEDNWLNKRNEQDGMCAVNESNSECAISTVNTTSTNAVNNANSSTEGDDNADVDDAVEPEMGVDKVLSLAIAPGGERFAFPSSNGQRLYVFERTSRNEEHERVTSKKLEEEVNTQLR